MNSKQLNEKAVKNFQKYLQIRTVQPNPDYDGCVEFLRCQAKELQLPIKVYEFIPKKPVVVISWIGLEPSLPSIMLNSHMDVDPVDQSKWKYDAFAADIDTAGNIYGRGTQDMKSVGIQYLEAVRRLQLNGVTLARSVHITFVPDEEIGGGDGMKLFVKSNEFKQLNVGFSLDESGPCPNDYYVILAGEKILKHIEIVCKGTTGHGSIMYPNTAVEKVHKIMTKLLQYRDKQISKLNDFLIDSGNHTSINITMINGGLQENVIPPEIKLKLDCRVHPDDEPTFWTTIQQWCQDSGPDVHCQYLKEEPVVPITQLNESNPYWLAFKSVFDKRQDELYHMLNPGTTDGRYLREIGIPVIGFSPMKNTQFLLHGNDEFISTETFLTGIDIYEQLIQAICNIH